MEESKSRADICRLARLGKKKKKEGKRQGPWGGYVLALQKSNMAKRAVGSMTVSMPAELLQLICWSAASPFRMMAAVSGVCQSWRSTTCGMHVVLVVQQVVACMDFRDAACLMATCSTLAHTLAPVRERARQQAIRAAVMAAETKWLHVRVMVPWSADGLGVEYAGVVTGVRAAGRCLRVELDERAGKNTRFHTIPVDELYVEGSNVLS